MHQAQQTRQLCDFIRQTSNHKLENFQPDLLRLASRHGVLPLLAQRVLDSAEPDTSSELLSVCRSATHQFALVEALRRKATQDLLSILREAKHDCLLLKGTALAYAHYEQPWQRMRSDVDVWINQDQAPQVATLLRQAGYKLSNVQRQSRSSRQFQACINPVPDFSLTFDIHLEISNRALFREALDFRQCLGEARPLPQLGGLAPRGPELLLHACFHRIAQGRNTQSDKLIWIYDIHLLYQALSVSEKKAFVSLAIETGLGGTCADGLQHSKKAFATNIEPEVMEQLLSRADHEPASKLLNSGKLPWLWSDLLGEPSWTLRAGLLAELIGNRVFRKHRESQNPIR